MLGGAWFDSLAHTFKSVVKSLGKKNWEKKKKTRFVCEKLMPPKHPSFEKHDHNI